MSACNFFSGEYEEVFRGEEDCDEFGDMERGRRVEMERFWYVVPGAR
jgi:hypothetical protein